MLFQMRLHGIETCLQVISLTLGQWRNILYQKSYFIKINSKNKHRAGRVWTDKPPCHT